MNYGSQKTILERDSLIIWLFALPFLLVGLLFICLPWAGVANTDHLAVAFKLLFSGMGLISVLVSVHIFRAGLTESLFDPLTQTIILRKRFSKQVTRTIEIRQVKDIIVDESKDSDGDHTYRLALLLNSAEKVPLTMSAIYGRSAVEASRERIKRILETPGANLSGNWVNRSERTDANDSRGKSFIVLVLSTILIVSIAPFAGWWLAAQERPARIIAAGAPSPQLDRELHQRAAKILPQTEKILFVACPEPGHEGKEKIWFMPFAIVWTLFAIIWTALAVCSISRTNIAGGIFMTLFGLPFVAVGLGMLATPHISIKRELNTIYAISDERILVFSDDKVHEMVKFKSKHFGPIEAKHCSPERMDLLFYSSLDPESPGVSGGFWGIADGETAKAILEKKLQETAKVDSDSPAPAHQHHRKPSIER